MRITREILEELSLLMDEIRNDYNITQKTTRELFLQALRSPVVKEDLCNHFDSLLGLDEQEEEDLEFEEEETVKNEDQD